MRPLPSVMASIRFSGDDFKVAAGFGLHAERIDQPRDILPAIRAKKITDSGQPALLEIITREESAFSLYE